MTAMNKYLLLCAFLVTTVTASAQGVSASDTVKIPTGWKPEFSRELKHDNINKAQKAIAATDGTADKIFTPTSDEDINFLITQALIKKVDVLQYLIETDKQFDHRLKVNYLTGLENILKYFLNNWKSKTEKGIKPANLPSIINAYEHCVAADRKGESIEPIIRKLTYDGGMVLVSAGIFDKNAGLRPARNNLVLQYCLLHPDKTFSILSQNPDMPFADSLIRTIAKKYPKQLYDFAQANNKLGNTIRNIKDDDFIKAVNRMARSKDGQQYFCFLDNIVKGRLTYEEIDAAKDDSLLYYRLLVKTQIDYAGRALNKDTAFEFKALTDRLGFKAREGFVNIINGLHNESAEIRFKCIQPLTAEELYYLAVSSDGSIYTSSFVKGVYPLMMKKINNRGDSLLVSVHFDRYRKLIKMAAGYNTLANFLSSFPKREKPEQEDPANTLMRAFVKNLEKADGPEDAVDVADSYASIAETIKPLADEMLKNVQDNYKRNVENNNKKGIAIYKILKYLFLSADTTQMIDLTKELGVPPVYEVPYKSLVNDSGVVIIQQFFYGDKDGMGVFNGFVKQFTNANWKVDQSNKQWVKISSLKGKPVTFYANRALPEEGGEDEKAQAALCEYLEKNKLYPTITIHRGHSYYADATIDQMFPSSKIVFLGSCGGYHLLHSVLEVAPDAHIIASKQIGATEVNRPFIQLVADKARNGNNIDWIPFWKEFDKSVGNVPEFADYIPPYKNLGALFIKAYKIAMGE